MGVFYGEEVNAFEVFINSNTAWSLWGMWLKFSFMLVNFGYGLYCVFWMPQIPFAFEFECEWPNDLCTAELPFYWKQLNGNLAGHFKIKIFIFLSVNGQIVIQMTCVWPNCHLAVHTQTQTQTETEGYRMHAVLFFPENYTKVSLIVTILKSMYLIINLNKVL